MVTQSARNVGDTRLGRHRRLLLIAATMGCVMLSIQKTAGTALARRAPEVVLRIAPNNALALTTAADRLLAADLGRNMAAAAGLAERSLRRQGLNAPALRVLGYAADITRQHSRAQALIGLSERMSRRDRGTQLWLIEQAVAANDIPTALHHYDIALRTTDQTAELLFPILTAALNEPAVRAGFVPYVRARPFWMEAFLAHAIAWSDHPERIAAMMTAATGALSDPRNDMLATRLVERLLVGGQPESAQRIFLAMPGRSPARLVSPAFDPRDRSGTDGAIGWRLLSSEAAQATLDGGPNGAATVLHVEASSDGTGRVAEKALFLSPATYRLTARVAPGRSDSDGTLRWRLECVARGAQRELWTRDIATGDLAIPFTIGTDCGQQALSIDYVGQEGRQDASVDVTDIAIRRD